MTKQYKLTGSITLPIEMIVECDSKKIAPSELAEKILMDVDDLFDESELVLQNGWRFLDVDGNVKEIGAIEFNDIEEQNPLRHEQP